MQVLLWFVQALYVRRSASVRRRRRRNRDGGGGSWRDLDASAAAAVGSNEDEASRVHCKKVFPTDMWAG